VDEWIDKIMNIKQQEVAQMNMVEWSSDSQELGKKPSKIEFVKKFELYEMHYYIWLNRYIGDMLIYSTLMMSI
jgi:hypothetical protein